ncbi:hypothetical protein MIMGU_mgv1a012015mg [Erythranthe guttata]|uniref:Protein ABIL2 n=1 Tax=Erythranthe guttata TaxID=4155 RepID=A0A022RXL8_ERYGU|nr:hypothetical protein MIMGU_mgv1a012015mg [Erythranthe guttata]
MGSDAASELFSITAPRKCSNYNEIFMQHSMQFADSLKDLKNLREQLYSAAEYFESSYEKDDHQQFVIESSKDYVAKALVSTVDHLGSVADKLNKFVDEKANEFSTTNIRFSCIEQRLNTFRGFIDLRGVSQKSLIEAPKHYKQYIIPGTSRISSSGSSPNPANFSFTRVISNKEAGKRSVSPFSFPLKRSGSVASRSVSPSPSTNKHRSPSEPRRGIFSAQNKHEMVSSREREIESYTKRSKHLFKALLSIHRSRKDNRTVHMI